MHHYTTAAATAIAMASPFLSRDPNPDVPLPAPSITAPQTGDPGAGEENPSSPSPSRPHPDYLVIRCEDTGPGIPPQHQGGLFTSKFATVGLCTLNQVDP
jgi:hypothetical protein